MSVTSNCILVFLLHYFDIEIKYRKKLPFEAEINHLNTVTGEKTKLHLSASYIFAVIDFRILPSNKKQPETTVHLP